MPAAFQCPRCGRVSHHPEDVANRYCSCCGNGDLPKLCPHTEGDDAYLYAEIGPDHRCPDAHERCGDCGAPTACVPIRLFAPDRVLPSGDIDSWAVCDDCAVKYLGGAITRFE